MENLEEKNGKEELLQKIIEERTHLIAELFSNPPKERRREIEQKILELDQKYKELV